MDSFALCVVALCATGVFADYTNNTLDIKIQQERQADILLFYYHIQEPTPIKKFQDIASSWTIEKNFDKYNNVTAASQYVSMIKNKLILPRNMPYAVYEPNHIFETIILFLVLYSAKTYAAFYSTAVYLRNITNEGLFMNAFSVAILHRPDTQGLTIPPVYETSPNYFNKADIIFSGLRINAQGKDLVNMYPSTYIKDDSVVIKSEDTNWFTSKNKYEDLSYYTNDYSLNALYYYNTLLFPSWLSSSFVPGLNKDRRGELWWYRLKQIVARYYLECLCNGLGEIPALSNEIAVGYTPYLLYGNGVPFPSRPDNFSLNQDKFANMLQQVEELERSFYEAIKKGSYINGTGDLVSLRGLQGINNFGLLVHFNGDSPNYNFNKDLMRLFALIVGNNDHNYNSVVHDTEYAPLVIPSTVENYETALRDHACYMVLKRILNLFSAWNKKEGSYTLEELTDPTIQITKVETGKLVTFIENRYLNITNALPLSASERTQGYDDLSVMAKPPRLNHKSFNVSVSVKSKITKTVKIKIFLGPKHNSEGFNCNMDNFFQLEEFTCDLVAGDNVIVRNSTDNQWTVKDWLSGAELYEKVVSGKWVPDASQSIDKFPHNLLLPKGTIDGMKFQLVTYIMEYKPGTEEALGFPLNRPLYDWQVGSIKNLAFSDVTIYHEAA